MKLKNIILTTCIATTALLFQTPISAQGTPSGSAGGAPKFGPEKDKNEKRPGKRNPEERIAKMKEALGLTAEQETKIREIFKTEAEKMRAQRDANKGNKPAPEERRAKMQAARQEVETAIKAVLTPEQQAKWETIKKNRGPKDGPKDPSAPESDIPKP